MGGVSLSAERFDRKAMWRDFAVLYRSNHQARIFEQTLRDLRIPYVISGGQSFFDKAEIRDVLAYLRLIANDQDDPAFIRAATTPRRGIGQTTLQKLGEFASQRGCSLFEAVFEIALTDNLAERQLQPLQTFAEFIRRIRDKAEHAQAQADELLDELLNAIDYERYLYDLFDERPAQSRWTNVLELVGWLKRKASEDGMSLRELVQHVTLVTMLERNEDEEEPDAVRLSTLHASKGLEYPHVFLVGVEEGLLPHLGRDDEDFGDDEQVVMLGRVQEERRLMYVGITRAQRSLRLSWCKRRRRAREYVVREQSRFIEEMALEAMAITESPEDKALSPKERLGRLKDLLNKTG